MIRVRKKVMRRELSMLCNRVSKGFYSYFMVFERGALLEGKSYCILEPARKALTIVIVIVKGYDIILKQ